MIFTCHGEDPYNHVDIPPSHNGLLHPRAPIPLPLEPGRQNADHDNDQVKEEQHHQTQHINSHGLNITNIQYFYFLSESEWMCQTEYFYFLDVYIIRMTCWYFLNRSISSCFKCKSTVLVWTCLIMNCCFIHFQNRNRSIECTTMYMLPILWPVLCVVK